MKAASVLILIGLSGCTPVGVAGGAAATTANAALEVGTAATAGVVKAGSRGAARVGGAF